jgi:hypothetical protein
LKEKHNSRWRLALGALLLVSVASFAVAISHGASSPPAAAPPPTAEAEGHIVLMGLHGRTSEPFFLDGGSYRGIWSAWGESPSDPPCTHSVALVAVDSANPSGSINLATRVQVPGTGVSAEVDMPNLEAGDYFFEVASACAWQIDLSKG